MSSKPVQAKPNDKDGTESFDAKEAGHGPYGDVNAGRRAEMRLPQRGTAPTGQDQSPASVQSQIVAKATETFGEEKADIWLSRPTSALGGNSPLSILHSEDGVAAVEALLDKIDQGFAA